MQRSVRSRKDYGNSVPQSSKLASLRRRTHSSHGRDDHSAPRLIGLPLPLSLLKLKGVRSRYCNRYDEQPAALLAASLLRLGIATPSDFTGSAVDMVARTLSRICQENGAVQINEWMSCHVSLKDTITEMSEYERQQSGIPVAEGDSLYLNIEYSEARVVPLRGILDLMEQEHELLPAAFFSVFWSALSSFTLVYSTVEAEDQAEMWLEDSDDEDGEKSLYQLVFDEAPSSMRRVIRDFVHLHMKGKDIDLVCRFQSTARNKDVRDVLAIAAQAYDLSRPYGQMKVLSKKCAELFEESDLAYPIEGAILCWEPCDAIHGLFDEDSQARAQGNGFMPFACLEINMLSNEETLDARVQTLMDFVRDMARALQACCRAFEVIETVHERFRADRKK